MSDPASGVVPEKRTNKRKYPCELSDKSWNRLKNSLPNPNKKERQLGATIYGYFDGWSNEGMGSDDH